MDLPEYELMDFGEGRKLERFGDWVLDRPCPGAAEVAKAHAEVWSDATARYKGERAADGIWSPGVKRWDAATCSLQVDSDLGMTLQLAPLPSGQVGVFFEQYPNWRWIARQVLRLSGKAPKSGSRKVVVLKSRDPSMLENKKSPPRVLNLFAYSGASTLAAAAAGAEVTHVDAAKSVVSRARENARLSGLEDAPIRWIVEDALKFCQREVKRGNHYDGVILDPPSYGHGPNGEAWSINRDLLPLVEQCGKLLEGFGGFALITCHTPSIGPAELGAYLSDGLFGSCGQQPNCGKLFLQTREGRKLSSGVFSRWPA